MCDFLGKPVPDVPVPRVNETDVLDKKLGVIFKRSIMRGVKKVTLVVHHCWLSGWLGGSRLGLGCEGAGLSSGLNLGHTKTSPNGPNITDIIYS